MSASPNPALSEPAAVSLPGTSAAAAPAAAHEVDASCRVPVLLLFVSAAVWLAVGLLLATIASIKLHAPMMFANCGWLAYGRLVPAHWNAFAYGFALQAGLGAALWIMARLGRAPFRQGWLVATGAKLWNIAVTVGIIGILYGDSTGYEWYEMPRYASGFLFFAFALMAGAILYNFHQRREAVLYPSQWYLVAALLWFPWIITVAFLMLLMWPVRGVMLNLVAWWYAGNLVTLVLGSLGLAVLFYFIPKQSGRPLHSHYLALFGFWTLAALGGWSGVPVGAPLPGWISSVSASATVALIVPVLAVATNLYLTGQGSIGDQAGGRSSAYFRASLRWFILAGVLSALLATAEIAKYTAGTLLFAANKLMISYGFVGAALLGAVHYLVPRLTGTEWTEGLLAKAQHFCFRAGVVLAVAFTAAAGILQGLVVWKAGDYEKVQNLTDAVTKALRGVVLGELLLLVSATLFVLSLVKLLADCARRCCAETAKGGAK